MSGSKGSGVLAQERVKLLVVRSVLKHGCVGPGRVMVGEHSGSWRSATVPQFDQVRVSQESAGIFSCLDQKERVTHKFENV